MQKTEAIPTRQPAFTSWERLTRFICLHWFAIYTILLGIYVGLPFLAPIFMWLGFGPLGNLIYAAYSTQCHQLPERSFFFFGPKVSYSLAEIQAAWKMTNNPLILREFTGNAAMGWKVAWSDRMVSMFGSMWVSAFIWKLLKQRLPRLPWWGLFLFLLPMGLDGGTHFISDLAGIGNGFRDSNAWLSALTNGIFPPSFYVGDALGSFNSWMRLLTGLLFGIGVVWFTFPFVEQGAQEELHFLKNKHDGLNQNL